MQTQYNRRYSINNLTSIAGVLMGANHRHQPHWIVCSWGLWVVFSFIFLLANSDTMNAVSGWLLNIAAVAQGGASTEMLCSLSIRKFLSCKMFDNVHQCSSMLIKRRFPVLQKFCWSLVLSVLWEFMKYCLTHFIKQKVFVWLFFGFFKLADVWRLKGYWNLLIVERFRKINYELFIH